MPKPLTVWWWDVRNSDFVHELYAACGLHGSGLMLLMANDVAASIIRTGGKYILGAGGS